MPSLWIELGAMGAAALVAAALIWAAAGFLRRRYTVVFVEVVDDETRVSDKDKRPLLAVPNLVVVKTGGTSLEPVSFGELRAAEIPQNTRVIELSSDSSADHLWQPFMGYVLLETIEKHRQRVWGLKAMIRMNLSRDEARTAFLEAVTPESMKALGIIEVQPS